MSLPRRGRRNVTAYVRVSGNLAPETLRQSSHRKQKQSWRGAARADRCIVAPMPCVLAVDIVAIPTVSASAYSGCHALHAVAQHRARAGRAKQRPSSWRALLPRASQLER